MKERDLIDMMKLKGFSVETQKNYIKHMRAYHQYCMSVNKSICTESLHHYIIYLMDIRQCSFSYVNQAISAAKFYSRNIEKNCIEFARIPRPRKKRTLPKVLSLNEVLKIMQCTENLKHKTMLMLTYSSGLRVSEVVHLKAEDIDSERMMIRIRDGKGGKDRYSLLSEEALKMLRAYYRQYKPREWLFESPDPSKPMSSRSIQKVFKRSCLKAGVHKQVSIHSLRHSFATHLLESGVDIRYIQELLGHKSTKTTEIYTHVSNKALSNIKNPLDQMMQGK